MNDSTLVIFTSDNGSFSRGRISPHLPSRDITRAARFRGHKADIFEGGHRIPFFARWPGKVPVGSTYDDTICLTDLLATRRGAGWDHVAGRCG